MKLLLHLKDFRLQRYESGTQELIGSSCEMTSSKLKYFNSLKTHRCKRVDHIASPQTPQTRRPGKFSEDSDSPPSHYTFRPWPRGKLQQAS
ncbi:hypothetical protein EYF80_034038 [Liparis tanakae]|uniref:Uncharacterized protein n=1 Tax=Liparis tanakae TaxID=230148 RepID=A0A4Z2GPY4_9TELE|nr:hypothetical protein EYF80_034038 [Liparis tanakae]